MKSVLVTGGAGFIGSHMVDALISRKYPVFVLDNFSAGNMKNLNSSKGKKNFSLVRSNLKNIKNYKKTLKSVRTIFHLAAYPDVRTGYDNPQIAFKENIENTYRLLEFARSADIEKIIFASSSVVYGEPQKIPTPENYGPLLPISQYGGSKLACEAMISSYCHNYGIKGAIIRLANVIGARSNHGVIFDFINKLYKDPDKLQILGDGTQTKSYVHISDCVEGFLTCFDKSEKNVDVFNLGNNDKIDVYSIAKIICKNMKLRNVKLIIKGGTRDGRGWIGDVKQMQLGTSKLKHLGWQIKHSSREAVDISSRELIESDYSKQIMIKK